MDEDVRSRVLSAKKIDARTYIKLLMEREEFEKIFFDSIKSFDVLVTPTIANEAPILSDVDQSVSPGYFTRPFNYVGMCALSLQMGLSKNGLPVSFQVAARPHCESLTIQVGASVEREVSSIFKSVVV